MKTNWDKLLEQEIEKEKDEKVLEIINTSLKKKQEREKKEQEYKLAEAQESYRMLSDFVGFALFVFVAFLFGAILIGVVSCIIN